MTVAGRQSTAAEIVKPRMARGKAKGDTMKVERTLLTVFPVCSDVKEGDTLGCCLCQDELCDMRITVFGDAAACLSTTACSKECPRAIQKEDIEDAKNNKEPAKRNIMIVLSEVFEKARSLISAEELIDNKARGIIEIKFEEYIADSGCFGGGFNEVNLCPVRPACDWSDPTYTYSEMCHKWGKNENSWGSRIGCLITVKGKKYVICGSTVTIKAINDITQFRGDYNPNIRGSFKQIRFIKPGMFGWGKALKFTNEEQYYARMEMFRKDPNYREV